MLLLALLACSPSQPGLLLIALDGGRIEPATLTTGGGESLPVLTALSGEGAMYRHAYAVAGDVTRSHAALWTGRYASELGAGIPASVPTVAAALRQHGFATGLFSSGADVTGAGGFGQGYDTFEGVGGGFEATATAAEGWIGGQTGPWFATLHVADPGPARAVDDALGELLVRLRGRGKMDATTVIVVSEPEREPTDLSEPATRVGLVARGPGFRAMGHMDALVDVRDVAATLVAAGGAPPLPGVTGRDIRDRGVQATGEVYVEGDAGTVALRTPERRLLTGPGGEVLFESPLVGVERRVDDPATTAALRARVDAWRATVPVATPGP